MLIVKSEVNPTYFPQGYAINKTCGNCKTPIKSVTKVFITKKLVWYDCPHCPSSGAVRVDV